MKESKPEFGRQESWRYKRVKENWRRPRGVTSKMRKEEGCEWRRGGRRWKRRLRSLKTKMSAKQGRALNESKEPEETGRELAGRRVEQGLDRPGRERSGPISDYPRRDQGSHTRRKDQPPAKDRNQQRQTSR